MVNIVNLEATVDRLLLLTEMFNLTSSSCWKIKKKASVDHISLLIQTCLTSAFFSLTGTCYYSMLLQHPNQSNHMRGIMHEPDFKSAKLWGQSTKAKPPLLQSAVHCLFEI